MKRNRIQTFLPIAISLFILVFPFYPRCSYFEEVNAFPTDLGFENPDQDDQFIGYQQNGSKAFALNFLASGFHLEADVWRYPPYFFTQTTSLDQEDLILRC